MPWARGLRASWRRLRAKPSAAPQGTPSVSGDGYFDVEDIQRVSDFYFQNGTVAGGPWEPLRHAHLRIPTWVRLDLDPWGAEYAEQQMRLWRTIAGVDRPYEPDLDETEAPLGEFDVVRQAAFYMRRDAEAVSNASDHTLASGMILKHSGLRPGDWALEYGAGFGNTALALARLGVNVDTVDISRTFCSYVEQQAEHFRVPLSAFHGHFGDNPRSDRRYRLVWFYESFHHCLDFQGLLRKLPDLLADGGRVLLCGEPMVEREYAAVPYPWGVRLHSEVVAIVRRMHWFELGFSEDFLFELFARHGFVGRRYACEPSLFGRTYVFERRADEIDIGAMWLPPVAAQGWHDGEPTGRWTRGEARLWLDNSRPDVFAEIELANHLRCRREVSIDCDAGRQRVSLAPGECRRVALPRGVASITLRCATSRPGWLDRAVSGDTRRLGVFVQRLRYRPVA